MPGQVLDSRVYSPPAPEPAGRRSRMGISEFYARHPYPPAEKDLDHYLARWDEARRRVDFHLSWPRRAYQPRHSILVAGCGTSQAAKHALRWPQAQVTAIDFSDACVAHTRALKERYTLDNLQVHCLPIERAAELDQQFDRVICTGVLHHLPSPPAGLDALASLLAADGAMHLMVYAPYGRTGIYMIQALARMLDISTDEAGLDDLVRLLSLLPPGHPLEGVLRRAPELRDRAALADALLNPLDRAYTTGQFLELMDGAGLALGRWVRQAPYDPECGLLAAIPQRQTLRTLPRREQFAAAELFRGTMLRHSAIVHHAAHAAAAGMDLETDAWLGYVPLRMPDTLDVTDAVPDGAVAVLLNRTHEYTDIGVPLRRDEHEVVQRIDGRARVRDIAGSMEGERLRALFRRLWRHDQIAFDASPGAVGGD